MIYTEEFKLRCKKAYPDFPKLHKALEEGSEEVGRYLNDSSESGIFYDEILAATSLEELKAKALLIKEKCDLYEDYDNGNCLQTKADLYRIMKDLFQQTVSNDNLSISYTEFYKKALVENSAEFLALQKHLLENNVSFDNIVVKICFKEVQQEYLEELSVKQDAFNYQDFYALMKLCFVQMSDGEHVNLASELLEDNIEFGLEPDSPYASENFKNLREFMFNNNISVSDEVFSKCFYDVKQDYLKEHPEFNRFKLNARVIDDDGFKGRVIAYKPQVNMYLVEHDFVDGKRVFADGWYSPERLKAAPEEKQVASVDSLISRATAISEQSRGLADDLGKLKDGFEMTD